MISCVLDSKTYLEIGVIIQGQSGTGTPNVIFYTKGKGDVAGVTRTAAGYKQRYGYKTKNGILFVNNMNPGQYDDCYCWLLGKTNTGKICIAHYNGTSISTQYTAAIDETSTEIGQGMYLCYKTAYSSTTGKWLGSSQLVTAPIPTHPDTGTSFIKGALGFVISAFNGCGIVEINGVKYATDSVLALNDED